MTHEYNESLKPSDKQNIATNIVKTVFFNFCVGWWGVGYIMTSCKANKYLYL